MMKGKQVNNNMKTDLKQHDRWKTDLKAIHNIVDIYKNKQQQSNQFNNTSLQWNKNKFNDSNR